MKSVVNQADDDEKGEEAEEEADGGQGYTVF